MFKFKNTTKFVLTNSYDIGSAQTKDVRTTLETPLPKTRWFAKREYSVTKKVEYIIGLYYRPNTTAAGYQSINLLYKTKRARNADHKRFCEMLEREESATKAGQ